MSTAVHPALQCHDYQWAVPCVEDICRPAVEEPQHPYPPFHQVTHSTLKVPDRAESPQPDGDTFKVTVFDGFYNTKIPITMRSLDTIAKLKRRYARKKPHLSGSLNLALNGKPVDSKKTLGELGVKPGAMFIIFQRCTGG